MIKELEQKERSEEADAEVEEEETGEKKDEEGEEVEDEELDEEDLEDVSSKLIGLFKSLKFILLCYTIKKI